MGSRSCKSSSKDRRKRVGYRGICMGLSRSAVSSWF